MPVPGRGQYDSNNIFARILRGEIPSRKVFENEFALAFHDINPQAPVHVLVIPKGEFISIADFSESAPAELIAGFWRTVGEVARQLQLEAPGYRILANMGADAHQEVPHFHVHILGGRALGKLLPEKSHCADGKNSRHDHGHQPPKPMYPVRNGLFLWLQFALDELVVVKRIVR